MSGDAKPWWPMCAVCGHPVERLEMEVTPPDANTYRKAVRRYRVFCHGQSENAFVGIWAAWEIQCKHGRLPTAFVTYAKPKPEPPRCQFSLAYVGRCDNGALPGKSMCSKHDGLVCRGCGAPATRECPSASSLVCGAPICDVCEHDSRLGIDGMHGRKSLNKFYDDPSTP